MKERLLRLFSNQYNVHELQLQVQCQHPCPRLLTCDSTLPTSMAAKSGGKTLMQSPASCAMRSSSFWVAKRSFDR
jgi:hypothetical protein